MNITQAVPYRTAWVINLVAISMESCPIARFINFCGTRGNTLMIIALEK